MLVPMEDRPAAAYRYGFNGKEKDDEMKGGEGNSIDYGFRMHDPRVGRFMSVDPLTKKFAELTPYQFSSNTPIWAIDLDGMEAYFSNEGVFQKWGKDKSKTAQVIVDNKVMSLNVSEMLNRAHWVYGEGGGTMTNQLANALNNRAKLLGENEMYKGMTTWSKARKVDPDEQKEIYFFQTKTNSHEQVNSNYKDFNRLIRNNDENIDFTPKAEVPTDVFKIGEMNKAIASTVQSLSGNLKDDLNGAAFWASGGNAKTYSLGASAKGSIITKVSQTTAYGVNATHYFYKSKKHENSPSNKDCTTCIQEIKLERPKLTSKKKS
jgi:RHS repeat-associated protein